MRLHSILLFLSVFTLTPTAMAQSESAAETEAEQPESATETEAAQSGSAAETEAGDGVETVVVEKESTEPTEAAAPADSEA